MFLRYFTILSLLTVLGFYACKGAAVAAPTAYAPTDARPALVRVGVMLRNIVAIDEVRENWQAAGLLIAKWNEPRLRFRAAVGAQSFRDLPDNVWRPNLEFANEDVPTNFRFVDLYAEPDGTVVFTQSFNTTLSTNLDLRRFPFDSQRLQLVVQARGLDLDRTILKSDLADSTMPKPGYAGLAQWLPVSFGVFLDKIPGSAGGATNVEFTLKVQRTPKFYIFKFIIPLILLVIISWVTFWLSHEEFKTKDQLGSAVSTLLIIVAFNITASAVLPKTDYITYIDAILFTCFIFVVISIAAIVGIHLLHLNSSAPRALRVRRLAGFVLPAAFLLTQVFLFVSFHIIG